MIGLLVFLVPSPFSGPQASDLVLLPTGKHLPLRHIPRLFCLNYVYFLLFEALKPESLYQASYILSPVSS